MSNARNLSQGDTRFVNTSGDTMTGDLSVTGGDVGINTSSQRTKLAIRTANSSTPQEALNLHNENTTNGSGTQITFSGFNTETQYPTWRYAGITGAYDITSSGLNGGGWGGQLKFFVNRGGAADQFEDVLKISGGGHVTMPRQPSFLCRPTAGYSISGNTVINGTWYTTPNGWNTGSYFNLSNGTFTAPIAGKYFFHWTALVSTSDGRTDAYLLKNGTEAYRSEVNGYNASQTNRQGSITAVMDLSVNDYVNFGLRSSSGSPSGVYSGNRSPWSYATGYLIG